MSLKRQVASGFFWVALAQVVGRGLSFVTTLILARLLAPALFGLVSMAGVAIAALQFFQDVGFDAALVYRRDDVSEASHTAFFTVIATSSLVYLVAALAAPAVGVFFREPNVVPVLRVLALTILISGFSRVPYILLSRALDFRRKIFPELTASFIGNGAAIVLALTGAGVWSLVWGQVIRTILSTALIWVVTPWRPKWRFSLPLARELFNYGKHVISSQTLIFLITNVDNAIVGRYAGDAALGFYGFAYSTSNQPATQITGIVSQVMFPTISKLGGDNAGQTRARFYLTVVRYVAWITAPIAVTTILFAPAFIYELYGATWAPAIIPLQFLAVYGLIRSIAANMGSIFLAMGKPQWLTYIAIWRLTTMVITLYPVTKRWGIDGVSILSAIVAVVDFIISATLVNRLVDAPWRAYLQRVGPPLLAALAAGLAARGLYPYLQFGKASFRLMVVGVLLVVCYAGLLWLVEPHFRATAGLALTEARRLRQQWQADRSV